MEIEIGDLVEVNYPIYNHKEAPTHLVQAIVTDKAGGCLYAVNDHYRVYEFQIKRIIRKRAIDPEMLRLMRQSLFLTEPPGHVNYNPELAEPYLVMARLKGE